MNLKRVILRKKYTCVKYLRMMLKLLPTGPAWDGRDDVISPSWVFLNSYIEDKFTDLNISSEWDNEFRASSEVQNHATRHVAIQIQDLGSDKDMTGILSNDFQIDFGIMLLENTDSIRLRLIDSLSAGVCEFGWSSSGGSHITVRNSAGVSVESIPLHFTKHTEVHFRIQRISDDISFKYRRGSTWSDCTTVITEADDIKVTCICYGNNAGFTYLQFQASTGLPFLFFGGNSYLVKLLACFANAMCIFDDHVIQWARNRIPGLADADIDLWETELGLPDAGSPSSVTLSQRRDYANAKFTQGKGTWPLGVEFLPQTEAYYIEYALNLGIEISISSGMGQPFRWTTKRSGVMQRITRMPAPEGIDGSRFNSTGVAFTWIVTVIADPNGSRSIIEEVFTKVKPAHTRIVFVP